MSANLSDLTPDTQAAVALWLAAVKDAGYDVKVASTLRIGWIWLHAGGEGATLVGHGMSSLTLFSLA